MSINYRTTLYILFCLLLTCFLCACLTTEQTDNTASISGTKWKYSDEHDSYEIEFGMNGRLITTHPNDTTPENDYWEQEGNIVRFSFDNFSSEYEGEMINEAKIKGIARNADKSWDFEMIKTED